MSLAVMHAFVTTKRRPFRPTQQVETPCNKTLRYTNKQTHYSLRLACSVSYHCSTGHLMTCRQPYTHDHAHTSVSSPLPSYPPPQAEKTHASKKQQRKTTLSRQHDEQYLRHIATAPKLHPPPPRPPSLAPLGSPFRTVPLLVSRFRPPSPM